MKTFENYLQDVFYKENPQLLDDDMPDAFDNWISGLDSNDVIEYAEGAVKEMNEKIEKLLRLAASSIDELQKIRDMAK
jgi:hypothetical protein